MARKGTMGKNSVVPTRRKTHDTKRRSTKPSRHFRKRCGESSSDTTSQNPIPLPTSRRTKSCKCSKRREERGEDTDITTETPSSEEGKVAPFNDIILATDIDLGECEGVEYQYDPFYCGIDPEICGMRRRRLILGQDGEPELVSDYDSDEEEEELCPCKCKLPHAECHKRLVKVYVTPPVLIPRREFVYHVNVVGEGDVLEVDRLHEKHPLANCQIRAKAAGQEGLELYPPDYVQGVCSDILDPDIPGPRWLGEEFDKTEEELERERLKEEQRKEDDLIEYEF